MGLKLGFYKFCNKKSIIRETTYPIKVDKKIEKIIKKNLEKNQENHEKRRSDLFEECHLEEASFKKAIVIYSK